MMRSRAAYFPFTLIILILLALAATSSVSGQGAKEKNPTARKQAATQNSVDGLAAWQQVYSVLTHPRCINCHTATSYPQQGDDRHRHLFNVVRGPEGKGVPGLNCATCHQGANADSTGVPGAHDWHLAPLAMKWQDTNDKILSSSAVCKIVIDPAKNNGRDGAGILKHHTEEPLVLWGFAPGRRNDGTMRALPPLTHAQFVEATRRWVEAGTPCP